jgi:DNA-binding transcriptional regulator GbsR (MarR family)
LPSTDKEYVAEIIRKQVIELKREKLTQRVEEAKMNLKKGFVKSGDIKELLEDLESD